MPIFPQRTCQTHLLCWLCNTRKVVKNDFQLQVVYDLDSENTLNMEDVDKGASDWAVEVEESESLSEGPAVPSIRFNLCRLESLRDLPSHGECWPLLAEGVLMLPSRVVEVQGFPFWAERYFPGVFHRIEDVQWVHFQRIRHRVLNPQWPLLVIRCIMRPEVDILRSQVE